MKWWKNAQPWDRIEAVELALCAVITAVMLMFFNEPVHSNLAKPDCECVTVIVERH